jgi:hypothetical protein
MKRFMLTTIIGMVALFACFSATAKVDENLYVTTKSDKGIALAKVAVFQNNGTEVILRVSNLTKKPLPSATLKVYVASGSSSFGGCRTLEIDLAAKETKELKVKFANPLKVGQVNFAVSLSSFETCAECLVIAKAACGEGNIGGMTCGGTSGACSFTCKGNEPAPEGGATSFTVEQSVKSK